MRDEKEERSKQGQTNKQGKATRHTQGSHLYIYSLYMYNVHVHVHVYTEQVRCGRDYSCTPDVEGGEGLPGVQLQRDYLEHATVEVEGDDTAPGVHQPDLPALRRPPHTVLPGGEGTEVKGQVRYILTGFLFFALKYMYM